jgi:hypothetical protein
MKNWAEILLGYLPVVLKTAIAIEGAIKAPGATKRKILVDIVSAGAKAAGEFPEEHVQGIGALADIVVGALNTSGIFQKSGTVPGPVVPVVAK